MKRIVLSMSLMLGVVAQAVVPSDVYLLIGQSNMAGRGDVSVENVNNSRMLKWGDAGGWVEATEPLYRVLETAGAGPGMSFGRAMAVAEPMATGGLVCAAVGV